MTSVVVLPWLDHGHISSFLELAQKHLREKFSRFFCSMPIILNSVKPKLYDEFPELPPHYHVHHQWRPTPTHAHLHKKAMRMASPNFSNVLKTLNPNFLICDSTVFFIFTVVCHQIISFHHLLKGPSVRLHFHALYLRDNEISKFNNVRGDRRNINIDYLSELMNSKIMFIGSIVHNPNKDHEDKDEETYQIIEWLNKCETSSSRLELSQVSFIWVIRFPREEKITRSEEVLPQRGLCSFTSVGRLVSHCGWSSVLESMNFGVPIIAMPIHLDKPFNARLLEELGVGVEVKKTGGSLRREEVAKAIKVVPNAQSSRFTQGLEEVNVG
ncbi:unnamed protein product [Malus baccata var. baccata]